MSNNNVAVISLMAKFDEKSVEQAAKKLGKTTEEALSDIGQDKFGENIVNEFNKAMDIIKKKLKGVNLSSYTNNVLDSLFSKKDIQEKTKDLQNFISNITNLSKSLSGLGNSALNSMSTKQLDSIISKQKKVLEKEEEIAKKRKELESTARNIGNKSRNSSTISKNYLQSDYEQSYKSLEKLFSTEKGFTSEQQKSIKYLSEMLTLYSDMEKIEPGKGTSESIKYASDLLTVVKEINKVSKDIDSFTNGKASKFVNKNFNSTKKVNEYNPKIAQQDFVKAGLSTLNAQKAKLEKDLTEYISKSIEKNLEKITNNAEQSIDKANQKAEKLKNTIDELHSSTGNKPIITKIVDDSQVKSLEEIEDRLLDLQDKYLEVDKNGYAVNDLDTKELKEFIRLYNQYISMLPKDNKFESDLPDTYKSIIDSDDELKKYADNVQKINKEKQKLAETEVKSNAETNTSKYTEDLKEQQQQIEKTAQAEKDLQETQKAMSDTIINVDTAQALSNINAVKESLESLPSEKNIKISVNNTDYSSVPLLSNEEGKTVDMFRGVKNAWSGLVNDKGIGFFTDKLELAVDYADELAKDGKVIQANLSLHNPLEVEGNGARWDQIDFEGVKQKTDDIIEKAKQLGYDGVIFKNIRDGFTDAESDLSNVVAVFDAMSVKNEQVIGTVKAGTGELTKIESTANSMADAIVESQEKVQLELKETQVQAEETAKAVKDITSAPQESNISSGTKDAFPTQTFDNEMQQNLVMLENYKNTIKEIDKLKLEPDTEETKNKIEELNKLADYFISQITVIRGENGHDVSPSMMKFSGLWNEQLKKYPSEKANELYQLASDKSGFQVNSVIKEFSGIESEITNIEAKSEGLRKSLTQAMQDSTSYVKNLRYSLTTIASSEEELKTEKNPKWIESLNKDIDNAISKFPVLEEFKNKFSNEGQALDFIKSDSWNDFLSTLPQAKEYLQSIGYNFEKINSKNSSTNTKSETEGMEQVEKATKEAAQAKKDFATANEGVQSSIDGSENPLKLEAELMEQVAKSAREAADAKKEFAKANKQVKDSANGSNSENKQKDKYAKHNKVSEENFLNDSNKYSSIVDKQLNNSNYAILGKTVNTELINGLIKVTAKIKDVDGVWKSFSAKVDADGNIFEQRFKTITKNVDKLETELEKTNNSEKFSFDEKGNQKYWDGRFKETISSIGKCNDELARMNQYYKDIEKEQENLNSQFSKMYEGITKYNNQFAELGKRKTSDSSDDFINNLNTYQIALNQYSTELDRLHNNPDLINEENISNLKKLKNEVDNCSNAFKGLNKGASEISRDKLIVRIADYMDKNTAMTKNFKTQLEGLIAELKSMGANADVSNIADQFFKVQQEIKAAGQEGKRFWDIIAEKAKYGLAAQIGMYFGFNDIINVIRQAASTVTELNTQITELAKVSEQSSSQIYADFDSYADIAKEVRGTISDTIAATADWSKNGYSIPDAKKLAEVSQLYKNVGDGIDINTANESLISTLKGFQLEADQAEHIVDVFNEVSNNEAISSGGIGEALQRSAASFNAASTSLEKSVSLVTATNSVLQNPEKVGNMWRTVSARLRGSETELKEMGEDTDGLVTSTSKLQALVKGITGFDIMKDKDTYKDIYDIVLGIGEKWQDLSDIDRASLLEALAGKQQSNALAAALSNIDILKKSYEEATNAEGSARKENEEYSKSIQASIDLAKAKLEELANDTLNSNFLKGAIDAGGKLIEVLDGIVKSGNAIPTLLAAIGTGLSFKNIGKCYVSA